MKKKMKRCINLISCAVGYTVILAGLYATAISYMVSARKADDQKH